MKKTFPRSCCFIFFGLAILLFSNQAHSQQNNSSWKAGVGSVEITPSESIWMGGYAARDHPSEGVRHSVWAKALAIEDRSGKLAVLVTADLLAFRKILSDKIRTRLRDEFGLSKDQIILNSSHTHTGPETDYARFQFQLSKTESNKIQQYANRVEKQVVEMVGNAIKSLEPVTLSSENGVTRFQVNRRNNKEAQINAQTELNGPNDYAVPVIKVEDQKGNVKALLFGYACHPTVLSDYRISGDYAGFAQLELEKLYPGTTALFFQGAGADQNPLPRRTIPLARKYGKELAAAVESVLEEEMKPLAAQLKTAYSEVELGLNEPPSNQVLEKMIKESSGHYQRWAKMMYEKVKNKEVDTSYPYPIQIWKLGDQFMIALGGEPVVDYSIKLKTQYGKELFVLGYSNDVMAYIPTRTVLNEGGYEGATSQIAFGHPGTWKPTLETEIFSRINEMMAKL